MLRLILLFLLSSSKLLFGAKIEFKSTSKFERVIADYSDVITGVPIDFRYNESTSSSVKSEGLSSVPGCPKSEEGIPWVYYGSPQKCYLAGEKGPCGTDEALFLKAESPFGICNCGCFGDGYFPWFNFEKLQFCKEGVREFVFDPESQKCFAIYEQGPCDKNQWLVKAKEPNVTSVHCEERKCPSGQIPWGGRDPSDKTFTADNCFAPISPFFSPVSITPNACLEGTTYSKLLQKCITRKAVRGIIG